MSHHSDVDLRLIFTQDNWIQTGPKGSEATDQVPRSVWNTYLDEA